MSHGQSNAVEFYFDFSSPYGYLAAQEIDDLAESHGRKVIWRPILLGPIFKQTGSKPLLDIPLKGEYAHRDIARAARRIGVPFRLPQLFPFSTVGASRIFYWLADQDEEAACAYAKVLFREAFEEGRDISQPAVVSEVALRLGYMPTEVEAALDSLELKERLRREVDIAITRKVFGSPFFFVDGEPFWGNDRLADVDLWLQRGGW